jgi:hypothetical protein
MQKVDSTTQQQVEQFQSDGFVVIENALTESQLSLVNSDLSKWVEKSKQHTQPFRLNFGRDRTGKHAIMPERVQRAFMRAWHYF